MYKKFLLIITFLLTSSCCFAVDRKELNIDFFERFNDDCLIYYINSALNNNHDLKKTSHIVEQYRQQVKYSFGKELPSFSVRANYLGVNVPRLDNFELQKSAFILPFMANYEPDFLLKNRDKTKSYKKAHEASEYEEKAIYISLLSDLATVYVNILEYDELIQKQYEVVQLSQNTLNYDERKFQAGILTTTQLNNSRKVYEDEKNQLEELQKQQEVLLIELAMLSGICPDEYKNLQRGHISNFEYDGEIPSEVSSDVIFSRPDIMKSEKNLEKAKIDVRVAKKEFFPAFNITGLWIFNTIAPGTFFSWESSLAAILAGASQDIFQGGRKVANFKIQKAKYEELFEEYRQTSIEAVKEVNTALCFIKHDTEIEKNTKNKLMYENSSFSNSIKQYQQGTISNLDYINRQIPLINSEQELIRAKTQRIVNYFTLYKAVGGQL